MPRRRVILVLAPPCAAALVLLGTRMIWAGDLRYGFLAWNLFLALVPVAAALGVQALSARVDARGRTVLLAAVWLLFLPNAPYVVTDAAHLTWAMGVPRWLDVLLFASFAWASLLAGLLALHVVHRLAEARWGPVSAWAGAALVLVASSAAIFVGRYAQWNSWDLVIRPHAVLDSFRWQPGTAFGVTAAYSTFLLAAYVAVRTLLGTAASAAGGGDRRAVELGVGPLPPAGGDVLEHGHRGLRRRDP
jgi:uncharacterized membrane protein